MVPIYGRDVADGTYAVDTDCSSPFFKILEARLTVQDHQMQAVLTMYSQSYLFVYMGSALEAAEAPFEEYIPLEEGTGRHTFTIPVEALNRGIECAAFSKKREKWYSRLILFDAASLPADALSFALPDYLRVDQAIRLYDKEKGTDTWAEFYAHARGETLPETGESMSEAVSEASQDAREGIAMEEPDGSYAIDVVLTGGSGRASVTSPTWLYVRDGKGYAKLLWSSVYYDYMIVDGVKYLNETTDGSNSTFTIPITVLNEPMHVIADTTAMGDPLEIEYELTFYADTVGSVGRVPQEGAKKVIVLSLVLIIGGGIVNYFVKKRKN